MGFPRVNEADAEEGAGGGVTGGDGLIGVEGGVGVGDEAEGFGGIAEAGALVLEGPRLRAQGFSVHLGPEELHVVSQAVNDLLLRLQESDAAQSRFIAAAAHELRSPITALSGELELALDGPIPEGMDPQGWPQRHRQALAASPLAVEASALDCQPEAPLVWSEGRLRWRRWHLQLETCLEQLIAREVARGVASTDIVLAGFSQGGAIALQTALRHPARLAP
jgi:hypothetical protein